MIISNWILQLDLKWGREINSSWLPSEIQLDFMHTMFQSVTAFRHSITVPALSHEGSFSLLWFVQILVGLYCLTVCYWDLFDIP